MFMCIVAVRVMCSDVSLLTVLVIGVMWILVNTVAKHGETMFMVMEVLQGHSILIRTNHHSREVFCLMLDEACKTCAFHNPCADLECDFGRDNLVICSVLMRKRKEEKREVKYGREDNS